MALNLDELNRMTLKILGSGAVDAIYAPSPLLKSLRENTGQLREPVTYIGSIAASSADPGEPPVSVQVERRIADAAREIATQAALAMYTNGQTRNLKRLGPEGLTSDDFDFRSDVPVAEPALAPTSYERQISFTD